MPISQMELEAKISKAFPEVEFKIIDLVGDENHYMLEISGDSFENLSRVAKHRKVNEALKDCLGDELHALTVKFT